MNDACTFETRRSSRDSGYSEDGPRIQTTWRRTGYFSDPPYPHQECSTRKSTPWFGIRQTERDISCLQDSCASPGKAIVKGRPPGRKRGTSSIPTRSVSKGQLPSQPEASARDLLPSQPEASARDISHPNPKRQQGTTPIPTRSVSKGQLPSQPVASARDNSHPNPKRQQGTFLCCKHASFRLDLFQDTDTCVQGTGSHRSRIARTP